MTGFLRIILHLPLQSIYFVKFVVNLTTQLKVSVSPTKEEVPRALVAMSVNNEPDPNWYFDTGETARMSIDYSNLASSTSYFDNDKIYISHTGKTTFIIISD